MTTLPVPVLVSACLVGLCTRYDGTDALDPALASKAGSAVFVPVCPEQLGGLPTPRPKANIVGGAGADVLNGKARVMDENGHDVTGEFIKGAESALKAAQLAGAKKAYLKEKSPSCGLSVIYDAKGVLRSGAGVTAALLVRNGIEVTGL